MDKKKLYNELLKSDGIDPAEPSESEWGIFIQLLDKQLTTKNSQQSERGHIFIRYPMLKYAAAILIIIGILTGIYKTTGSLDGTTVVWASTVKKCQNFNSIAYSSKSLTFTYVQNKEYNYRQLNFIYSHGQSKITRIVGSSKRGDFFILNETYYDMNQMTHINHDSQEYFRQTLSGDWQNTNDTETLLHLFKTLPEKADKSLGSKIIDQQQTVGFFLKGHGIDVKIWVNKQTNNPVLIAMYENDSTQPSEVYCDFRFDADVDASLVNIHIPATYAEIDPPEIVSLKDTHSQSSVDDLLFYLRLYATHSNDGCFPDTVKVTQDKAGLSMSVSLSAIEYAKVTESEKHEMQVKGPRTYDFLSRMKPENDWHYAGKDILPGSADTPICWWKEDGVDEYTVIFADLSVGTLTEQQLPE